MTLCIAWREKNNIHLASDSRITLAENSTTDVGIKVISFPVAIYPPMDETKRLKSSKPTYNKTFGMCVAGSQVNSHLIKESITEILQHLHYAPGWTEISMDQIAKLIFKVYEKVSSEVCSTALAQNGITEIVVAGYCPKEKRLRAFQFRTDERSNKHSFEEVLKVNGDYLFFGSGAGEANKILSATGNTYKHTWGYLKLLQRVIDEGQVKTKEGSVTVGGNVQYGDFYRNNFKIYGVFDRSDKNTKVMLRGLNMDDKEFNSDPQGFILSYSVIDITPPGRNTKPK